MPAYRAPLRNMRFLIDVVLDFHGSYAANGAEDEVPT
ncbi:acyl-CoA dehydrogenase N-terminal domain-containing protein [Pseudomonas stutzeri]|nr:acyl-CoA dehydrogenase N-terminal domain-containing protein [Stutzerimonas stutzeri]MCQ4322559.1 acyl-CoA dehydrogenase N-terminal domain-containing protein [Stutzerimonas stutzeri]